MFVDVGLAEFAFHFHQYGFVAVDDESINFYGFSESFNGEIGVEFIHVNSPLLK